MKRREDREGSKWRDNLAEFFDLPKDIVMDLPRITLVGNISFYLENHRGVIEYTDKMVRLSVNRGEVIVKGSNLSVKTLLAEEVILEGQIETVEFDI